MKDSTKQIKRLRQRIRESDEISDEDAAILFEFSDELRLLKSQYGDHRHAKLLGHCVRMAEIVGGLSDSLRDREAAEELVRWIHRTYENEETNHDYRTALRVFGKRVTRSDELPESLSWIPAGYTRNYDPKPNPSDMLRWEEDVKPMVESTRNSRDAALIAVAWDSGARSNELLTLTVGDITDSQYGLQVTVRGKTGQRTTTLIPSVPHLQRWLSEHPGRDERDAPLWSKLSEPEEISYQRFIQIFKTAAKRAGVTKPVTPTNFRKSSASHLASRGMNQAAIENHHGWVRGSRVASRYVAIFDTDMEREIARIHGVDVETEDPDPIAPLECPRCTRSTPRNEDRCVWCGQVLDREIANQIKTKEREVREAVLQLVQQEPEILTEIDRIDSLLTLFDKHPSLFEDAERFAQAIKSSG